MKMFSNYLSKIIATSFCNNYLDGMVKFIIGFYFYPLFMNDALISGPVFFNAFELL